MEADYNLLLSVKYRSLIALLQSNDQHSSIRQRRSIMLRPHHRRTRKPDKQKIWAIFTSCVGQRHYT
jgi:hypothetical protein